MTQSLYIDEQIRQYIQTKLLGNTSAGQKVFLSPAFTLSSQDMPCITINSPDVTIETLTTGTVRTQRRNSLVVVGCFVATAADSEAFTNSMLAEIETIFAADRSLGKIVSNSQPIKIVREVYQTEKTADAFFTAGLTYRLTYNTVEGQPTASR